MFEKPKGRDLALAQSLPKDPYVKAMLIAHERYMLRTAEVVPDRLAERDKLHVLIDGMRDPFPAPRTYEHPAMKDLRAYVADYQHMQEQKASEERTVTTPAQTPDRDRERDR